MNIIRQVHEADKRVRRRKTKSRINLYPLLGILLAIVLAVLTYGGLFAFLF
jgi:biopolymer transport protein ExbD